MQIEITVPRKLQLSRETLRRLNATGGSRDPTTATDRNGDCPGVPELGGLDTIPAIDGNQPEKQPEGAPPLPPIGDEPA